MAEQDVTTGTGTSGEQWLYIPCALGAHGSCPAIFEINAGKCACSCHQPVEVRSGER